jgi:hypothetical protein
MSDPIKSPTTLLGSMLEADETERLCYGCAHVFTVQAAFSVLANAIARIASKLDGDLISEEKRARLREEMQDAHRIADEYRVLYRAQRLAMTAHLESKRTAPSPANAARH